MMPITWFLLGVSALGVVYLVLIALFARRSSEQYKQRAKAQEITMDAMRSATQISMIAWEARQAMREEVRRSGGTPI